MSKGVVLLAVNTTNVDYVKQAYYLAKRIHKYINVPVSIITNSVEYVNKNFNDGVFDNVIKVPDDSTQSNTRLIFDGAFSKKTINWKNGNRASVYELTPYDETLVLDTDFIISNSILANCFNSIHDFLIYKHSLDVSNIRTVTEFTRVSDTSIDFYWATCVFFRKTDINKIFFDLINHIKQEWNHYKSVYQLSTNTFRNDYAFSIAIHIMNGFQRGNFAHDLPGKMYYSIDQDILHDIIDDKIILLIQKLDYFGEYTLLKTTGLNIHVMNKASLERVIDKEITDE
tara:strand:+ start:545 stop:1399 length:855 start_codon:yes stop_codon:yes gene_type:complete